MWILDKLKKLCNLKLFVSEPYMTRPVGSKFYRNGRLMRVVKERNCGHCAFFGDTGRCFDLKQTLGECSRLTRTDKTNVVFIWDDEPINKNIRIRMNDFHRYNASFLIKKLWDFR